ncbi:MAG: hypothetical protein ACRDNF_19670 [Streptosporangiaceae bacterium]
MPDEMDLLRLFRDETPQPSTDAWARARAAVTAAKAEETRQHRRAPGPRRRWLLPAASLTAAAAAVSTVLAVLLPGSPAARTSANATLDAYVTHVEHALGAGNLIGYARTEYPHGVTLSLGPAEIHLGPTHGRSAASPSERVGSVVRWSYQGTSKISAYSPAGQLVFATRVAIPAKGPGSATAVLYRESTWWHAQLSASMDASHAPPACSHAGVQLGGGGWPAYIRGELHCGGFTLDGRQRVDGVDAMKMTGDHGTLTLWVNLTTYLPVRVILAGPGQGQTDFRWLTPTATGLAQLNLQIPAHFRQVTAPV